MTTLTRGFLDDLEGQGFSAFSVCGEAGLCAVKRYNFTYGLVVDLQPLGHGRRDCYEHLSEALSALADWDGRNHPSGPWIKCKGASIDLLNPDFGCELEAARQA